MPETSALHWLLANSSPAHVSSMVGKVQVANPGIAKNRQDVDLVPCQATFAPPGRFACPPQ